MMSAPFDLRPRMKNGSIRVVTAVLLAIFTPPAALMLAAFAASPVVAQSTAQSFYAGKQITLLCGAAVGGGYDALARLMARHFGRLIPGNPNVIVQNLPAAGSLVAANQIYNASPKDGTVISLIQRGMLTSKLINPAQTRFDVAKLNWLGS